MTGSLLWWYWYMTWAVKYLLISRNLMTFKSLNADSVGSQYFIPAMIRMIVFCWTTNCTTTNLFCSVKWSQHLCWYMLYVQVGKVHLAGTNKPTLSFRLQRCLYMYIARINTFELNCVDEIVIRRRWIMFFSVSVSAVAYHLYWMICIYTIMMLSLSVLSYPDCEKCLHKSFHNSIHSLR